MSTSDPTMVRAMDLKPRDRVMLGGDEYDVVRVEEALPGTDDVDFALVAVSSRGMPLPYPFAIPWNARVRVFR